MKHSLVSRRNLIGSAAAVATAAATWRFSSNRPEDHIIGLGVIAPGKMPFKGQTSAGSALTAINTASGLSRTVVIPVGGAHALAMLPGGYAVIGNFDQMAFIDLTFAVQRVVTAESGWEFGGHGHWLPEHKKLLVSLRPARGNENPEAGCLVLIDPVTGKVEVAAGSGGYDPHDVSRLNNGQLAVCNYGHKNINDLRSYQNLFPNLVIIDPVSFKSVETIEGPTIGSLSHFCEGPNGVIAAIPTKLHNLSQESLDQVSKASGQRDVELTAAEIAEGKVGFPSPVLTYNRQEKSWKSFLQQPEKQRRPQSIIYHRETSNWFVTYPFSEQIVRISAAGDMIFLPAFNLGISYPRGLCVGRSGDVYVSGQFRGLASFNPTSLKQQSRWDVALHDGTHIYSGAAS